MIVKFAEKVINKLERVIRNMNRLGEVKWGGFQTYIIDQSIV